MNLHQLHARAAQQASARQRLARKSHAVPVNYQSVETRELLCLDAFRNGSPTHAQWNDLAWCRNVLFVGANHRIMEIRKAGPKGDPEELRQMQDVVELCKKGRDAMVAIRDREQAGEALSLTDAEYQTIAGLIATSAQFWPMRPAGLYRACAGHVDALTDRFIAPRSAGISGKKEGSRT